MNARLAPLALAAGLAAAAPMLATAQAPPRDLPRAPAPSSGRPIKPPVPTLTPTPAPGAGRPQLDAIPPVAGDPAVRPATGLPPEPVPFDQLQGPTIALPDVVDLNPFLIRAENGPFMVMARTFRGPDATKYAVALAQEFRNKFRLPAYIFHLKSKPGGSNIRNVQPTAPEYIANGEIGTPEKYRVFDEAAVLVGNCRTIDEAEKLLKQLKGLRSETLDGLPTIWTNRKGSFHHGSFITANPLHAAQQLYPNHGPKHPAHRAHVAEGGLPTAANGQEFDPFVAAATFQNMPKKDPLVERMNRGPRSLYKNPGPFTLVVSEFTGRQSIDENDPKFNSESFLRKSPLASAAEDAEALAESLARCKRLNKSYQPYVYHDRFGSKVALGSFNGPEDPALLRLRESIHLISEELLYYKYTQLPLAPARDLMPVPRQ